MAGGASAKGNHSSCERFHMCFPGNPPMAEGASAMDDHVRDCKISHVCFPVICP